MRDNKNFTLLRLCKRSDKRSKFNAEKQGGSGGTYVQERHTWKHRKMIEIDRYHAYERDQERWNWTKG